jgi:GT2 family glycosyltransferase/SAM-dependent methyltransferase
MQLSILLPNFNNGPSSSRDGTTDLLDKLLQSLHDTLADDPAELEILAHDDGSTDESLDTLRRWADTRWRGGRPFLDLTEATHHGVLARTTNQLIARATGDVLVRLDGDTEMLTPRWASRLLHLFTEGPDNLGVIAPKQLWTGGQIHACGDFILHPRGYHHHGFGLPRHALTRPVEVDHAMGCMYCIRRDTLDDVGPFDETFLRGQTIDYGLRVRQRGWRCFAHPSIEFVHHHALRKDRDTAADREALTGKTFTDFEAKWGFSRVIPDLEYVAQHYRGTGLLWNPQVFGAAFDAPVGPPRDPDPAKDEWSRLAHEGVFKDRMQLRVAVTQAARDSHGKVGRVVIADGGGPISHVLALQGMAITAIDRDADRLARTRNLTAAQAYPADPPTYLHQTHHRRWPIDDASADMVLLYDQVQHHPNPVALIAEARRVLRHDGLIVVLTQPNDPQRPALDATRFTELDLIGLVQHHAGFTALDARMDTNAAHRPAIVLGRRDTAQDRDATTPPTPTPSPTPTPLPTPLANPVSTTADPTCRAA